MSTPPKISDRAGALADAIEKQRAFEDKRATRLGQGAERLTAPIGGALARLIPPAVMRAALRQADKAAGLTVPSEVTSHDLDDIKACEAAALRVQAWAQGTNAATGGVAGWFGMAGLTADVPATITLAARNVRATGAAFGFTDDSADEQAYRLLVLEVATSMASEKRKQSVENLNDLARQLQSPEAKVILDQGGKWLTEKVFERLARQLSLSLASRKVGQIVPVVGGAVAAAVNASFQADVARAARYAYRQRWLMRRQLLAAPTEET